MRSFEELRHYLPREDTFFTGSSTGHELSQRTAEAIGSYNYISVVRAIRKAHSSQPLAPAILSHTSVEWGLAIFDIRPEKLIGLARDHLKNVAVEYDPDILQTEDALNGLRDLAVQHVRHFAGLGIEDSIELARLIPRHQKPRARQAYESQKTTQTVAIVSSSDAFTGHIVAGSPDEPNSVWYNYAENALETNAQTNSAHRCPVLKFTPAVFRLAANVQLAFPLTHPIIERT